MERFKKTLKLTGFPAFITLGLLLVVIYFSTVQIYPLSSDNLEELPVHLTIFVSMLRLIESPFILFLLIFYIAILVVLGKIFLKTFNTLGTNKSLILIAITAFHFLLFLIMAPFIWLSVYLPIVLFIISSR